MRKRVCGGGTCRGCRCATTPRLYAFDPNGVQRGNAAIWNGGGSRLDICGVSMCGGREIRGLELVGQQGEGAAMS